MTPPGGQVRPHYARYAAWLDEMPQERLAQRRAEADALFHRYGITFAVHDDDGGTERLIPFDIIPRIIPAAEWKSLAAGLIQRVKALNAFVRDVYHDREILRAGVLPPDYVIGNSQYRPEMQGVAVARDIYAHIAGVDIVRAGEGEFYVLEDNLRVPSGVSYEVLLHGRHGRLGDRTCVGDARQVALHERHLGAAHGHVGSGSHGDPHVRFGECRCVVDPVTRHGYHATFILQAFHEHELVRGLYLAVDLVDPKALRDRARRRQAVAGRHDDA
jgi:hypothetical protein